MAVNFVVTGLSAYLKLNNGTTPTGNIKTVKVNIGGSSQKLNASEYAANLNASREKVVNIAAFIENCMDKAATEVGEQTTGSLMES